MIRFPNRGGNFENASNAGPGAVNFNNSRANANSNRGFRLAFIIKRSEVAWLRLCSQRRIERMSSPRREPKEQQNGTRVVHTRKPVRQINFMKMAKTFNNLFEKLVTFDSLYAAYLEARKGKRESVSCLVFERDLEGNLINLQNELIWGQYKTGKYFRFDVYEPKKRKVAALEDFRDRVLHHALCNLLNPIYEARFIHNSYACRVGKGTHAGADKAQEMMRECLGRHGKLFALKADISKYFASIDHEILKNLIRKKISDKKILSITDEIIDSYCEPGRPGKGLPLGNLTSQLFANIYLNELDQHIKNTKQEKWYIRYMDDWVVLHHDKRHLQALRLELQIWLGVELKLSTNHKTMVFPISQSNGRGLDFLGYHLWPDRRRLRKASLKRFARRVRRLQRDYSEGNIEPPEIRQQLSSWTAHARHGNALPALNSILRKSVFRKNYGKSNRNTSTNA